MLFSTPYQEIIVSGLSRKDSKQRIIAVCFADHRMGFRDENVYEAILPDCALKDRRLTQSKKKKKPRGGCLAVFIMEGAE